jgi:hypothetical protein
VIKSARFSKKVLAAIGKAHIIGLRAGSEPHRFIAVWAVVVDGRVFVRSWAVSERSWYRAFRREPHGAIQVGDRTIRVRAAFTRSDQLKNAVSRAYREKYATPGSIGYARDLGRAKSRATTTELMPSTR